MSLYRRHRSPFWWSKLYVGGDVVRFSTGERTKVQALRVERERAEKLEQRAADAERYTFATLTIKFLDWKEANKRSPASIAMMEKHFRHAIVPHFTAARDPRTIDDAALEGYRTARLQEVAPATVCKELATLRQTLRYAAEVAKIIPKPAPTVRNPKYRYEPKWKILTAAALARLLDELAKLRAPEIFPWALLRANTGMRPTETVRLRWEMVDFERCELHLGADITKTRRGRTVNLNESALASLWLLALRRGPGWPVVGRMFHEENHYTGWRKACRAAGVWPMRPHDLRHTVASLMHAAGVPWSVVADALGHETGDMVRRYAHAFDADRRKAYQSIDSGNTKR